MVSNFVSKATFLSAFYLCSSQAAVINKRTLPTNQAIRNDADGFCLQHYAADDQLYSQGGTASPDLFTLSGGLFSMMPTGSGYTLTDTSVNKICVGSEGGGTASQFQCSGDPDSVTGLGEEFSVDFFNNQLLYNGNSAFYACGNDQTGENFFVPATAGTGGDNSCVQTTLTFVDPATCPGLPLNQALLNNADGHCLQSYSDDGGLYSQGNTLAPEKFSITSTPGTASGFTLTDTTLNKLCVGSEGSGTTSQFKCNNAPDTIPGSGEEFSVSGNTLLYNGDSNFYACGNEVTGESFFVPVSTGSSDGNCVLTTLTFVDPLTCSGLRTILP